jgi:hypothetical protein
MSYDYKLHMPWEVLLHSTRDFRIPNIIKANGLKVHDPLGSEDTNSGSTPGVYFSYLFQDLNYEGKYWYYPSLGSHKVIFGISTDVLKDKPFIICKQASYGFCRNYNEEIIKQGKGNLMRRPNLAKLQHHINENVADDKNDRFAFAGTHEVIVRSHVPLQYVKFVMVHNRNAKQFRALFPDIPIITVNMNTTNYKELVSQCLLPLSKE